MDPRAASAKDIFLDAVEIGSPAQRSAFLDGACLGDEELRSRVDALIEAHERPESLLDRAAVGVGPTPDDHTATADITPLAEGPGTTIGPYKLLEQIGDGGMGVVFMAEQSNPVRRKVALKVIKPGMDSRQVIARFEAERQALALMDHPNIARIFDGGVTDSGRPYFVMELVKGLPITEFCDRNRLTPRQRLELFVPICQAVQHAHQKGIIHRDLKPSNVLVSMHDPTPVVKVIDFGVAKALGQELTEKTLITGFAQMVGTPLYMSPEQAGQSALDTDTRSDIYTLGVLLYELLTGTTPFDKERFRQAAYDEIRRIVREEEPPTPSSRLSESGTTLSSISALRDMEPVKLTKLVRGELDWIVMKALEKDRNRRYETASGLANDVQRYLNDEPVLACPPSAGYRLGKFARRNKGPLLAGLALAILLVLGIAGTSIGLAWALRTQRTATAAANAEARQRRKAEAAYEAEVTQRRRARRAVDEMYTEVAEKWLAEQPRMEKVQREFLEKALQYYEEFGLARSDDPQERFEAGDAYMRVAEIRLGLGEYAPGEKAYRQAVATFEALVADAGNVASYRLGLVRSLNQLSGVLYKRNELQGAEDTLRRSLEVGRSLVAEFPEGLDHWLWLARSDDGLGRTLYRLGRLQEAEVVYRQALDIHKTKLESVSNPPNRVRILASAHIGLGNVLIAAKRPLDAERAFRDAVAHLEKATRDDPRASRCREDLSVNRNSLATVLNSTGRTPEAIVVLRRALDVQKTLVEDFPDLPLYRRTLASIYMNLGVYLKASGDRAGAEEAYRRAVEVATTLVGQIKTVPEYQHLLAISHHNLGNLFRESGRFSEAGQAYRDAELILKGLVERFPAIPAYRDHLSKTYVAKYALSWTLASGPDQELRDPREAVELATELVGQTKKNPDYWLVLGVAQYRAGDWKASLAALETSEQLRNPGDSSHWFFEAMNHWQLGQSVEAQKCFDRAVSWMEANQPKDELVDRLRVEAATLLKVNDQPKPKGGNSNPGG